MRRTFIPAVRFLERTGETLIKILGKLFPSTPGNQPKAVCA